MMPARWDRTVGAPTRIVLLTHSFPPNLGGVETVTHALAQGLTSGHGADVTVVTLDSSSNPEDVGKPFRILRAPGMRAVASAFAEADVVVFHSPILKFAPLAFLVDVPRINVVHGRMSDATNALSEQLSAASRAALLRAGVKVWLRKAFIRSATLPIAVSSDVAEECGIERVIHNGYDDATFTIARPVEERAAGNIAFVGRLSPEKGPHDAVEALALLREGGADVILHVVGDGRERGTLQAHCEQRGVADHVRFHGRLTPAQVDEVLNECVAVVVPSRAKEAFPMVGIEAQGAGCVVVATDAGGLPESLDGSGLIVPPGSPRAMADAVGRVLREEDLRAELRRAGQANAAQHTVARMVDEHHDAVMCVARRSGRSVRARLLGRLLSR